MFGLSWFKSSKEEQAPEPTWNPNPLTMEQPTSPEAPNQQVVTEQPPAQEQMQMSLRGGGNGGGICCGICAGLACFECCEICC
ncbi:hypothetical protein BDV25DRAFT_166507 [Aspergillus avenaceus]|uniref:Cysteine-rich transmembrane CYSTM domain-containing protein n=1 Tax=Aspergillus avenaceus TaxID=36643 RepID=A0A5N6TDY6_ASPAV|nr:hypothetical protein BDV25DRAFT_166507 [Aspergillus avenaceus]